MRWLPRAFLGLLGVALLASLLIAWASTLLRNMPKTRDPPLYWLNWSGAASAFETEYEQSADRPLSAASNA